MICLIMRVESDQVKMCSSLPCFSYGLPGVILVPPKRVFWSPQPGRSGLWPGQPGLWPGQPGLLARTTRTSPGQPGHWPGQPGLWPGQWPGQHRLWQPDINPDINPDSPDFGPDSSDIGPIAKRQYGCSYNSSSCICHLRPPHPLKANIWASLHPPAPLKRKKSTP